MTAAARRNPRHRGRRQPGPAVLHQLGQTPAGGNPTTGVPSASDSITAVPPGSPSRWGQRRRRGRDQLVATLACHRPDPAHPAGVDEGFDLLAPVPDVRVGLVGGGELRGVVARPDRTGQDQVTAEAVRGASGDMLPFARGDPAEHDQMPTFAYGRSAVGTHGQRRRQMHVTKAGRAQRGGRGGQLRARDPVDRQRATTIEPPVELGMLAQVPDATCAAPAEHPVRRRRTRSGRTPPDGDGPARRRRACAAGSRRRAGAPPPPPSPGYGRCNRANWPSSNTEIRPSTTSVDDPHWPTPPARPDAATRVPTRRRHSRSPP